MILKTERNTKTMKARVERAFKKWVRTPQCPIVHKDHVIPDVFFEHGQWWAQNLDTGAQWSVVDSEPGIDGFDFEQVTKGDEG